MSNLKTLIKLDRDETADQYHKLESSLLETISLSLADMRISSDIVVEIDSGNNRTPTIPNSIIVGIWTINGNFVDIMMVYTEPELHCLFSDNNGMEKIDRCIYDIIQEAVEDWDANIIVDTPVDTNCMFYAGSDEYLVIELDFTHCSHLLQFVSDSSYSAVTSDIYSALIYTKKASDTIIKTTPYKFNKVLFSTAMSLQVDGCVKKCDWFSYLGKQHK